MKFFLPNTDTPQQAEELLAAIIEFAKENVGPVTPERYLRISFRKDGIDQEAEVGHRFGREGEVVAILKSSMFLICTMSRGVLCDLPFLVGEDEIISAEEFEATESQA